MISKYYLRQIVQFFSFLFFLQYLHLAYMYMYVLRSRVLAFVLCLHICVNASIANKASHSDL